jgi:phosphonate transport system substrate-binding protein
MRKILFAVLFLISIGIIVARVPGCGEQLIQKGKYIYFNELESPPVTAGISSTDGQALRVAISSVLLPQETVVHYRAMANYLGAQVERPVILIQRKSYAEIALLLINGAADIAFFSSGEYANYSGLEEIEMLVGQQRMGLPYHQGYLLVSQDSEIHELADLKGKSVAFTDPLSYSGYTFLVHMLWQNNLTPDQFFGRYIFTYSHDKSFRAVAHKVVDAAPVTSLIYDRAKMKTPDLAESVRIIAVSPPAGTGPVVAGKNVNASQREILRQALLTMHEHKAMLPALRGLMIDRYVPADPQLYEPIRKMLHQRRDRL